MSAPKRVNVVLSGLANEVLYIREQRDLTLEVVCDRMGWQQSKLSRMENGQQCISTADLASLLVIYEVRGKERQRLLHLVERQDEPGYWDFDSPLDAESWPLTRLEPQAVSLVAAEPVFIPGLVQTTDYTRAVMQACNVPTELIEARVKARSARQIMLTGENPPRLDMIVDESALRRVFGGPKVMARQLQVLLATAELPNVRLWALPFEQSGKVGLDSSFYLMNLPKNKSVVYLASMRSGVYLENPEKIDYFRQQAAELAKVALNPAESAKFVATLRREYNRE